MTTFDNRPTDPKETNMSEPVQSRQPLDIVASPDPQPAAPQDGQPEKEGR